MAQENPIDIEDEDCIKADQRVHIYFSGLADECGVTENGQLHEWRGEEVLAVAEVTYSSIENWELRIYPDGDDYRIHLGKIYSERDENGDLFQTMDEWEVETIDQINEVLNDINSLEHRALDGTFMWTSYI